jgi:putative radical SAM enzyme (TIGR03279 family)
LFFKDEDTRLSFLHGNYTTMSSISKLELDRIIEQRLSPQYVSVHATDPEVRRYLLGRKRPDDVMGKMRFLVQHGIALHAQVVLCPTLNDGQILRQTADDLASLHPGLGSVAVVPVVFTRLHNYRHLLTPVTGDYAVDLIREVKPWQREFKKRLGTNFIFLADEFYMKAGLPIPAASHYGDYPQIEDGVGMVRRFIGETERFLRPPDLASRVPVQQGSLCGTVATGALFYPRLAPLIERLNGVLGTRLETIPVPNQFFGPEVTVAGLVTGSDVLKARDRIRGDFLVVPEQSCLKSGHVFLDDVTLQTLEQSLGIPVAHGGPSLKTLVQIARDLESKARAAA